MPSRREARYNPFFDPHYAGLHQAAHSGNVGLVEYALSEGQPVDTMWDGITPLHAAAAGGSEFVVRLLIEKGADVNLGRQYVEKREMRLRAVSSSSSLLPSPDSSISPDRSEALLNPGSTPLHYACAHNNAGAARLLLAAGAAPHIPDKRGVTPLDLLPPSTTASGSQGLASSPPSNSLRAVIREYYENEKAKEKEFNKSQSSQTLRSHQSKVGTLLGKPDDDLNFAPPTATNSPSNAMPMPGSSSLNRVAAKRSLENLLSMGSSVSPRRVPPPLSPSSGSNLSSRKSPPPSPARFTFGNATTTPQNAVSASSSPLPIAYSERRPSLPQIFSSSPGSNPSRPQMPAQQSSTSVVGSDSSGQQFQNNRSTTLPLPPNTPYAHNASTLSHNGLASQQSFDASRPTHPHHSHTHSATLPSAIASASSSSSAVSRLPRTKRSLLSLFSKNKEEKEDRERDRGRSKEKDKEEKRERSFSRPSFSTLSRPSFSAFSNNNGSPASPIPVPSRPSQLHPNSHSSSRAPTTNPSPSQTVITPPSSEMISNANHNGIQTAPPERTVFDVVPRSSRLKNTDDDDEEEEEYGVELRRRGGVYDYLENDEAGSDAEASSSDGDEEDEGEDISTSDSGSESGDEDEGDQSEDEDVRESHGQDGKPADLVQETASKRVADNLDLGSRNIIASRRPEAPANDEVAFPATPSAPVTTSSPSRPSILRDPINGRPKNRRALSNNSSDASGGLHRSSSLRFNLNGENSNYQGDAASCPGNDQRNNGGFAGAGVDRDRDRDRDKERNTGGNGEGGVVPGRRSSEGTRSPPIRKKSSLGLKERGSLSVLREGTIENGASPVKRTPKYGMAPLPPTLSSPSRYRTSPSDSKITTSPTRERARTSSSLSRRSPRTAVPPLPSMPPMKPTESATTNPSTSNTPFIGARGPSPSLSDSDDDLAPRLRTQSLRSRTPISAGIDLRSVSSHAEAEALVKLAAKEIIEMRSINKEPSRETPQMSLAEQLARYGETLHLERRFARGEAQRWKHVEDDEQQTEESAQMDPDEESKREAQKAAQEEENRRVKAKERMMWTQRNLDKYAKVESKEKDKDRGKDGKDRGDKEKETQETADLAGYGLQRAASLEKENGRSNVLSFAKTPGSNGVRRPHTSDSVQSNGSGSTVTPPRFGHNPAHSSSNIRFTPTLQPPKVFQRETPRSGSFDYDRPKYNGSVPMAGRRSEDLYRKRYEETEEEEDDDENEQQLRPQGQFKFSVPSAQSPVVVSPEDVTSASQQPSFSQAQAQPSDASTPVGSNTPGADEFGYNSSQPAASGTATGRPLRQRFGLKSLFGKNK